MAVEFIKVNIPISDKYITQFVYRIPKAKLKRFDKYIQEILTHIKGKYSNDRLEGNVYSVYLNHPSSYHEARDTIIKVFEAK